jgi:hypothetical protein
VRSNRLNSARMDGYKRLAEHCRPGGNPPSCNYLAFQYGSATADALWVTVSRISRCRPSAASSFSHTFTFVKIPGIKLPLQNQTSLPHITTTNPRSQAFGHTNMPPKKVKNKYGFMVNVSHPSHPHSPPSDKSITTSPKRRAPQTATEPIARPAKQSKPSSYTVSQAPSPARVYNTINRLGTTLDGARHPSSLAIMKGGVATGKDMPQKSRKGLGESDAEARYLFTCKAPRSDSFDEPTIKEEIPKLVSALLPTPSRFADQTSHRL